MIAPSSHCHTKQALLWIIGFCVQNEVPSSISYRSLEPIFALLLVKASDLNTRVAQGAIDRIVMLCDDFRRQPYAILPLVFRPARTTVLYRQAQSRVEIVARLVDEFGVYDRVAGKGTAGGLEFEVTHIGVHCKSAKEDICLRVLHLLTFFSFV